MVYPELGFGVNSLSGEMIPSIMVRDSAALALMPSPVKVKGLDAKVHSKISVAYDYVELAKALGISHLPILTDAGQLTMLPDEMDLFHSTEIAQGDMAVVCCLTYINRQEQINRPALVESSKDFTERFDKGVCDALIRAKGDSYISSIDIGKKLIIVFKFARCDREESFLLVDILKNLLSDSILNAEQRKILENKSKDTVIFLKAIGFGEKSLLQLPAQLKIEHALEVTKIFREDHDDNFSVMNCQFSSYEHLLHDARMSSLMSRRNQMKKLAEKIIFFIHDIRFVKNTFSIMHRHGGMQESTEVTQAHVQQYHKRVMELWLLLRKYIHELKHDCDVERFAHIEKEINSLGNEIESLKKIADEIIILGERLGSVRVTALKGKTIKLPFFESADEHLKKTKIIWKLHYDRLVDSDHSEKTPVITIKQKPGWKFWQSNTASVNITNNSVGEITQFKKSAMRISKKQDNVEKNQDFHVTVYKKY